ncbi:PucR family transcriptional regulator [Cryptosporangium aurantiacum]|uniref:Purine catabolism regulatory protein n=1 Tax=Cryptosporangium aurantiacum TaxID=134849 RepID=A0A1M7R9S5_9ACTN|nr:PucR family transcriptional regulator [Cryptosporangium aurantiacum]SHN43085.1 purine catabolism regulatory protein [Cryptosporangium aurantiacum]
MPVTVTDLLGLPQLDLRLVTGDPGAVVRWAHAVELVDPTPWLAGGELVLTTGLRLPRATQAQRDYVDRLADTGVTGIGFGTGLGHARMPAALAGQCEARGLVLLEVPLPTPFLAIIRAVADALARERTASVQRVLSAQHRITRSALNGGITGIVRGLAKALDAGVVVADVHQTVLAAAPGDGTALLTRVRAELGTRARTPGPLGLSASDEDGHLVIQSLGAGGTRRGWLAAATRQELDHVDQLLLTHAASLLALELERPREVVEAHRALRAAVLGTLLDGGLTAEAASRPLRHLGFAPTDRVVAILVQGSRSHLALAQHVAQLLDAEPGCPYLLTGRPDGVVVVVRAADQETVVDAVSAADLTLGISGGTTAAGLPAAVRAAGYAAATARTARRRVARFGELRLPALFADDAVHGAVTHLADDLLAPLQDHPELIRSLDVFLNHNGSWETASRALGVHRHTLRHRIARVAELTGLDLDSAQDRAALLLALLSRQR